MTPHSLPHAAAEAALQIIQSEAGTVDLQVLQVRLPLSRAALMQTIDHLSRTGRVRCLAENGKILVAIHDERSDA